MKRSFLRALAVGAVAALLLGALAGLSPGRAAAAGQVAIRSRICPATFDGSNATINDLAPVCVDLGAGVTVSLSHDNTPVATQKISAAGEVFFDNFSTGEAEIDQTPPDGYSVRAFCAVYAPTDARVYSEYAIPVHLLVGEGKRLECIFYNAPIHPAPASGPAALTITAYTCKPGYNVFAKSAKPRADCPAIAARVAFTLSGDANPASKQQTDARGGIVFGNLSPGAYTLTLTFPAGVTSAFVDSCASNVRDFSDYPYVPFARVGTSGKLGIALLPGEHLSCAWYDVPSQSAATPPAS